MKQTIVETDFMCVVKPERPTIQVARILRSKFTGDYFEFITPGENERIVLNNIEKVNALNDKYFSHMEAMPFITFASFFPPAFMPLGSRSKINYGLSEFHLVPENGEWAFTFKPDTADEFYQEFSKKLDESKQQHDDKNVFDLIAAFCKEFDMKHCSLRGKNCLCECHSCNFGDLEDLREDKGANPEQWPRIAKIMSGDFS